MTDSGPTAELILTSERLVGIQKTWRELGADAIGPRREEITPARLRGMMPWTFLVDAVGDDFRFRFAGDRIIQFIDTRLQGTLISERQGVPYFDGMRRFFARCVATKVPLVNGPARSTYPGKEHLEIEVMVLPLSDDGQTVSGILGAFDTWRFGTHT